MDRDRLFAASHSIAFGAACGVTMALAAAFSFAAARFGMLGGVAPDQLVLLRFLIASLFFFPFLMRWGLFSLAGIGWLRGLTLLLVGGPVFAWLQFAAYRHAPLAHGAIINPPTVAILSTIAAAVFLKERISGHHVAGAALVIGGIVLLGWDGVANTTDLRAWIGDLMFLGSAVLWACFTVLLRYWRLSAVRAVAVVSVLSTIILLPVYAISGELQALLATSSSVLITQGLVQGVLQGLIGTTAYSHAIRVLGVSRAVLFPAAIPALAILPGIPLVGERPSPAQIAGLGVVTAGLLVASGIWSMFRRRSIMTAQIMAAVWIDEDVQADTASLADLLSGGLTKADHAPRRRGQCRRDPVTNHCDGI
jgi:drug/metabolite transporter (DMT)-like permease